MSFCIKKYLVFSLRKSNNTKYYRTNVTCSRERTRLVCAPFFVFYAFAGFLLLQKTTCKQAFSV